MTLRPLRSADNAALARVIRTVMPEFGCVGPGYSINDPEVDDMFATYAAARAGYFVVDAGQDTGADAGAGGVGLAGVVGGAGFGPLLGGPADVCELRKMYLLPAARGHGAGGRLLEACVTGARAAGYRRMYLETVSAMTAAAALYAKHGFTYLASPLGDTGHGGCDKFMVRPL